ncbi:MAG: hypothetical protein ABEJ73_04275 [Haloplanus sp.]
MVNAVAFGMSGLVLPLFVWFIAIYQDYELNEPELKGIAAVEFTGFLTLFIMGLWHTIDNTFGGVVSLLFTAIPLLYGLLWLIAAIIHWYGADMKPLGIVALGEIPVQLLLIGGLFAAGAPVSWGIIIDLLIYAPFTLGGFYLFTHGYMMPAAKRYTGWISLLAAIATVHVMFVGSGIIGPILPVI